MSTGVNTIAATIEGLSNKGIRYATVIDVGCADGQFFLNYMRCFPGAVPLNIDANAVYENSLKAIKDVVGGDYRICAVTDCVGEIEITESIHPYWSSIRPAGDLYWSRVNDLAKAKVKVSATTLDLLAEELALKAPFLIKLDVQGAERQALLGAREILKKTNVVICEADIDDFQDINSVLSDNGFELFDLTQLSRTEDGTLGWFYPIYVNKEIAETVRPGAFWEAKDNEEIIALQVSRRDAILKANVERLNRLRYNNQDVSRNAPCPCGSGRKYRLCCGSYQA